MAWEKTGSLRLRTGLPSYVQDAANPYDARTSAYAFTSERLHAFRAAIKKLAAGSRAVDVLVLGDSTLVGYDGTSYDSSKAIPRSMGVEFASLLGVSYTDGIRQAMAAGATKVNDRWAVTGGFTTSVGVSTCYLAGYGAGTATWTSLDTGTAIELYYSELSQSGFTYSVDGGPAVTVTTTGTSSISKVSVTGLNNTAHSIKVTTTAGYTFIMGSRVLTPNVAQLRVHNLALGGSRADSGTVGQNWADVSSSGLGSISQEIVATAGFTPDLLVIALGSNDAYAGIGAATIVAGLQNLRGYWPGSPVLFVHTPNINGTSQAIIDGLGAGMFQMVDNDDLSTLFDWNDWSGGYSGYSGDGLAGADGTHPTVAEQYGVGRHLAYLLTDSPGPINLSTISGVGNAATKNVGTTAGTVAAGDDERFSSGNSQVEWTNCTLADGISTVSNQQVPRYCKDSSGFVHIEGVLTLGSGPVLFVLFTLPVGYRRIIPVPLNGIFQQWGNPYTPQSTIQQSLYISSAGEVKVFGGLHSDYEYAFTANFYADA